MMDIKKRVEQEVPEILKNIETLVSYPSVMGAKEEGAPFGKEVRACLDKALSIMDDYGFETKNLDGYAGYAQYGKGEKLIGMVGHLDVVPVSEHWSQDPFKLQILEDRIVGRGATDDKGPVCCAIGALRIVSELRPDMNARIRLVFGCNEENGSLCMEHYVKEEGSFDYGFTPDGDFPGINGEKGLLISNITTPTSKFINIRGGEAHNIVAGQFDFEIPNDSFDVNIFKAVLDKRQVRYEVSVKDTTCVTVYGVQAHASTPDLGDSSILEGMNALYEAGFHDETCDFFHEKLKLNNHGEHLGIHFKDEFGDLTLNVGLIEKVGNEVVTMFDMRFPVTMKSKDIIDALNKGVTSFKDARMDVLESEEPLFYDPNCDLVQALYKSYVEVTGDKEHQPKVIGGGTYAKSIKNTIAFGAEFPNDPDIHMHGDDEFMPMENIAKQTEIYVHALLNLLDLLEK